jgi:hypothetical protein
MTTRGIERAMMPATETAFAPGVAEAYAGAAFETETRLRVVYAAYNVPFGDVKALNEAQRKRPGLVCVRMPDGNLNLFGIELAIVAIQNGGKIVEV